MGRIQPDGYDVIVIPFGDGSATHTNLGTAGSSADWTDYGSPVQTARGLLDIGSGISVGQAMYVPSAYLVNARNGSGGGADTLVTPTVSISGWVFLRRYTNYFAEVFNKQYFLNGWSSPFLTFGFQMQNTNDGSIELYITLNGTLQVIRSNVNFFYLPQGRWCHVGGTWDGSTLRLYINGVLAVSAPIAGTIDYGTVGNRGLWYSGGIPGTSTNQDAPIIVQDIRVANIARPQSYFANIYYNGFQF